jgi:hypothetical protein
MSARKLSSHVVTDPHPAAAHVTVHARETRLNLSSNSVVIHKGGIEFRSLTPFAQWKEMTVTLKANPDGRKLHCHGVVVACTGNRHTGYHVSMIFTSLTRHAQAQLTELSRAVI